jgi:hypothetical protein
MSGKKKSSGLRKWNDVIPRPRSVPTASPGERVPKIQTAINVFGNKMMKMGNFM